MRIYLIKYDRENSYGIEEDRHKTFTSESDALQEAVDIMADYSSRVKDIVSMDFTYSGKPRVIMCEVRISGGKFGLVAIPEEGK